MRWQKQTRRKTKKKTTNLAEFHTEPDQLTGKNAKIENTKIRNVTKIPRETYATTA